MKPKKHITIDNFDPLKYGDFTRGEIIVIIQLLAAMLSKEEIITKFYTYFNKQKKISASTIIEIQADFDMYITSKSEEYLENIKKCPFAHNRILLDSVYDIYKECRKPSPSHTIKTGDNTYETIEKQDLKTALSAVKVAIDYQLNLEKLKLMKDKNKPMIPDTLSSEWVIDDGLNL